MAELKPADLAAMDPAYWTVLNKIRLGNGTFSLKGHGYQLKPLQSRAQRTCYMKGTQGGFSLIEILKTLHGLIHGRFPQGVLYMFPTADDMQEFAKSRFNPLIQANRQAIGRFVKSQKRGTDTASLKRVGDAWLFLRGARLTQQIGVGDGEKESGKLRSIAVDRTVLDELDLMDESVIAMARSRMGHSLVQEECFIANPRLPGYGIAKIFDTSDQQHLFRKCSCGGWTSAEISFPGCVKERPDGTGYIACEKCGKPVGLEDTEWVPSVRENSAFMEGYRWSQLSSAFHDPAKILADFNDPPEGNLGAVMRYKLGLPYVAAEDQLSVGVVKECCGPDPMRTQHAGPCAMGVDVGDVKHVVVGIRTGKDRYEILKVASLSRWEDIHDLAQRFNVKSAVVDALPMGDEARRFQKAEPYRVFLCRYAENAAIGADYNPDTGIVKADRTAICDQTHRMVAEQLVRLPRSCPEIDQFARQCCNAAKVLETNKRTGTKIYRYREVGTGGDHYRHALNYFALAAQGLGITNASGRYGKKRPRTEYAII